MRKDNLQKVSRRRFLKGAALLALFGAAGLAKRNRREDFYQRKLCAMAQAGLFGKIQSVRRHGVELEIRGTLGCGRADLSSLTANANGAKRFNFDGESCALFESVATKV